MKSGTEVNGQLTGDAIREANRGMVSE